MVELHLWFCLSESLDLYKTQFISTEHGLDLRCVRGRDPGAYGKMGSFPLSSAVIGLSSVLINAYTGSAEPHLSGDGGSHASSLDYAITKQTAWIIEMFGSFANGESFAKRIFKRTNSHRKRPGPVSISLNEKIIPVTNIKIYVDDIQVDPQQLAKIVNKVRSSSNSNESKKSFSSNCYYGQNNQDPNRECEVVNYFDRNIEFLSQKLSHWIFKEANRCLFDTDIFSEFSRKQTLEQYLNSINLKRYLGDKILNFNTILGDKAKSSNISSVKLQNEIVPQLPKIKIKTTVAQIGSLCIFYAIQKLYGLEVEIDLESSNTIVVLEDYIYRKCDDNLVTISTLALGATVTAMKSAQFNSSRFLSLAPGVSYMLISKPNKNLSSTEVLAKRGLSLLKGGGAITTSELYAQVLKDSGVGICKSSDLKSSEPNDILAQMINLDEPLSSILWFPHYQICTLLTNASVTVDLSRSKFYKESFFFISPNGVRFSKYLKKLIDEAWLELRVNPKFRAEICSQIASSPEYIKSVLKVSGLHSYLTQKQFKEFVYSRAV